MHGVGCVLNVGQLVPTRQGTTRSWISLEPKTPQFLPPAFQNESDPTFPSDKHAHCFFGGTFLTLAWFVVHLDSDRQSSRMDSEGSQRHLKNGRFPRNWPCFFVCGLGFFRGLWSCFPPFLPPSSSTFLPFSSSATSSLTYFLVYLASSTRVVFPPCSPPLHRHSNATPSSFVMAALLHCRLSP